MWSLREQSDPRNVNEKKFGRDLERVYVSIESGVTQVRRQVVSRQRVGVVEGNERYENVKNKKYLNKDKSIMYN